MKLVYAIIVTYNGIQWIEKCLHNLLSTNMPLVIMVIDNGSTDGTIECIEKNYSEVRLLLNDNNLGFGAANNIGIENAMKAKADYIFLINQDVYVQPDSISKLINHHLANPQYGILSPMHLDGVGSQLDYNFSTYLNANNCEGLLSELYLGKLQSVYTTEFINAACWLVSSSCFNKVGLFDSLFHHYGEDRNYCHRVLFHGFKIGICPSEKILHDRESRKSVHPNFRGLTHYLNETTATLADIRKSTFEKDYYRILQLNIFNLIGGFISLNTHKIKERINIISYLFKNKKRILSSIIRNQKPFYLD